jgi:hypothetical protein
MNTGSYTYVQIDTGEEKIWAVGPRFQVKVGDTVTVPAGLAMNNYRSQTLNRTFDLVYFVGGVRVEGREQDIPAQDPKTGTAPLPRGHRPDGPKADEMPTDFSKIQKPEGGKTVQEVFQQKEDLSGQEIVVRAKVVKFLPEIMDKNWIHLQDGTGGTGTNDLTVTTDASVKVGDIVLIRGKVTTDQDFGRIRTSDSATATTSWSRRLKLPSSNRTGLRAPDDQLAAAQLPGSGPRERADEADPAGHLEAGELQAAVGHELLFTRLRPLTPRRVSHTDDARLRNLPVREEYPFDLGRIDVLPARNDEILPTVESEELPLFVEKADVPGMEPSALEHACRLFGPVPVSGHDLRTSHENLSGETRLLVGTVGVDDSQGRTRERRTGAPSAPLTHAGPPRRNLGGRLR